MCSHFYRIIDKKKSYLLFVPTMTGQVLPTIRLRIFLYLIKWAEHSRNVVGRELDGVSSFGISKVQMKFTL